MKAYAGAKQLDLGFEAGFLRGVDDSSNAIMCETFCPVLIYSPMQRTTNPLVRQLSQLSTPTTWISYIIIRPRDKKGDS